jgi:hypothetical protein
VARAMGPSSYSSERSSRLYLVCSPMYGLCMCVHHDDKMSLVFKM